MYVVGMLSQPQVHAGTISPAEEALLAGWLTGNEDSTASGRPVSDTHLLPVMLVHLVL